MPDERAPNRSATAVATTDRNANEPASNDVEPNGTESGGTVSQGAESNDVEPNGTESDGTASHDTRVGNGPTTRRGMLAAVGIGLSTAGCVSGGVGGSTESTGTPDCSTPTTVEPVESLPPMAVGDMDAPVTVASWEDLSCPHCRTFALDVLPTIREEYVKTGDVRYVHHDFPIPAREWAWAAASAARGVQDAADASAGLAFTETVYERQADYDRGVLAAAGRAADVDPCVPITAAATEQYRPVVTADRQRGLDRGVRGTPTVFVAGEQVSFRGGISVEPVRQAIERAL